MTRARRCFRKAIPDLREVALTFDDGPDPALRPGRRRHPEAEKCPGDIFSGRHARQTVSRSRPAAGRDGFELANHTYNHQTCPRSSRMRSPMNCACATQDIFAATGQHTTLMRPPGVQYNDKVLDVARSLGYVTVSWTVGAKDYETDTTAGLYQRARSGPRRARLDHSAASGHARDGAGACPRSLTACARRDMRLSPSAKCWTISTPSGLLRLRRIHT